MSKQREAFDKWYEDTFGQPQLDGDFAIWQASRAAALEECEALADRVKRELQEDSKPGGYLYVGGQGAGVVADAIRALKEQS